MSVTPSPIGGFAAQFFDNNGVILSGGKIYTYAAGTTTPQASYTSAAGVTPHSNPIILDSAGRVPGGEIWLTDGLVYKFVIETATGILIGTYDNITGVNSNFVNYTVQEEVITATAGQTVFNLSTINYTPGTNSLTVYIDGVNQYVGDSYLETDSDTVTFTAGLHVGAEVKFTTAVQTTTGAVDASIVSYEPPFANSVATNVEDKLAQYVSVKDFGAVGDGVTDDTAAIQAAIDYAYSLFIGNIITGYDIIRLGGVTVYFPDGKYKTTATINLKDNVMLLGAGRLSTVIQSAYDGPIIRNTTITNYDAFGMGIQKMTIIGDRTKTNQVGVAILRDWFGRYEDVVVENCGSHGWLFKQCIHTRIDTIEGLQCIGNGIRIEDGQNSWADPTPNSLPSNTMSIINGHFYGNEAAGIYLGCVNGTQASVNGCQFYGCSSEYNYKSSQSGGNTGYNVEIRCASAKVNEFFSLWVEGGCQAHIYAETANVATPIRFIGLHHSANGTSGNVDRAVIAVKGQVLLDGPYGSGDSYKTIAGSNAPFRLTKATASMRVYNSMGATITDNKFVEDESGNTTALYNNLRMENYGWSYGFQRNTTEASQFAQTFYNEGEAQPYAAFVPGSTYGLGFGNGTLAPDVYMRRTATNTIGVRTGDFFDVGSAWNGSHLKMGGYRLWVDATGDLRIKFGAPSSDTDGTVVGTQT